MYERFYNLRERPFSLTPDPDYLYPSRVHSEALSYLRYALEGDAGFVVITGEIGSGKTTMLQTVLRGLDRQTAVARLVNTMLDARELIEAVMLDFGLDASPTQSKPALLRELARFLVDQRLAGRLSLLVIDEAQNLTPAALEEVRMLSNLETEKSKLIQIVLIGQPNLRTVLARPELEQLRQRVTVSYHLNALDVDDTAAYINHRLRRASIGAPLQLSRAVTDIIHTAADGIPRKINIIADALLLFGYGEDRHVIEPDLVYQALDELRASGVLAPASAAAVAAGPRAVQTAPAAVVPQPIRDTTPAQIDEQLAIKARELAAREAQMIEREKQLLEQRRVLMEGFELLRTRETPAPAERPNWPPPRPAAPVESAAAELPLHTTRPAPMAAPAPAPAAAPTPAPARILSPAAVHTVPLDSFWTRVRRALFGSRKPVFED